MGTRTRTALVTCLLAGLVALPVTNASAAQPGPDPIPPSGDGRSHQHPSPPPPPKPPKPPKPPAPPGHVPSRWPVGAADRGRLVDGVQLRLAMLGYPVRATHVMDAPTLSAVSTFRSKWGYGASPVVTAAVWHRLVLVTRSNGDLPAACLGRSLVLCVDKVARVLRVVRHGTVVLTTDARFGGAGFETRNGTFEVYRKSRDHISTEYHTPMPFAMFFSGGQAVHYSPFFHAVGYNGHSHGCVNLRDIAVAKLLFDEVPIGTRVVVYGP
jgi:hypothetical protein